MAQAHEQERPTAPQQERGRKRIAVHTRAGRPKIPAGGPDVAEVQVSETRFKRLAGRRRHLRKLLTNYADAVEKAERSGQPETVALRVLPSGEIVVVIPTQPVGTAEPLIDASVVGRPTDDALDRALCKARSLGQAKVAEILKGEDMLTARAFGPLIDVSHETVNTMRKRFEVLGLEAARRGVRYPRWQVTEDGLPLPGLPRLFAILGEQPWTVYRFLRTAHAELGGHTALQALKAGRVETVLEAAQNQVAGHFA